MLARLAPNLSPSRSPLRHYFDLACGLASKFLEAACLAQQLEDIAQMDSMLGQGGSFTRQSRRNLRWPEQSYVKKNSAFRTRAFLEADPVVFCRQEQCCVDNNKVLSTGAIVDRSNCRQEPCFVDRSNPASCPSHVLSTRAMSTGGMFCRQRHSWRPSQQLGRPG